MGNRSLRSGFILLLILCMPAGLMAEADPDSTAQSIIRSPRMYRQNINWLLTQIRESGTADKRFRLVQSYAAIQDRCWIYDQALALMVFTATGHLKEARDILDSLKFLQNDDGSFYFSYQISTMTALDKRTYSGSNAWIAMAINLFRHVTGDESYVSVQLKLLTWLEKQMVQNSGHPTFGGISLGVRSDAFSTEHNLDTYAAFRHFGTSYYRRQAKRILGFIKRQLYIDEPVPHFITGYRDHSLYLDCQSWSVLTLGTEFCPVLTFAREKFTVTDGNLQGSPDIQGFFERQAKSAPVWSEGTAGMALAFRRCGNTGMGEFYAGQILRMMADDGGIAYATENEYDFSTSSSVAGTAWFIFYQMNLNPFQPDKKTIRRIHRFSRQPDKEEGGQP